MMLGGILYHVYLHILVSLEVFYINESYCFSVFLLILSSPKELKGYTADRFVGWSLAAACLYPGDSG